MAAFSSSSSSFQHHHPFNLLDSVFLVPNSTPSTIDKMCGLLEEPNNANSTTTCCFPNYQPQETFDQDIDHSTKVPALSNNSVLSLTNKNCTMDSSSIVTDHKFNSTTQKVIITPMNKKRKFKEVSSAQSKEVRRGVKGNKEKKILINGDEEKKKSKEEKKIEKKATEGYIHVRARRGQATDSHSLAERVRRERISERMKLLQALVPGCDKVTGKALMLDEIINYVQSLQNQVEFLSMKLVSVNPMFYDFGMDLESFMVRPDQNLNSLLPTMRPNSPTSAPNDYSNFLDDNNSLLFQHSQDPNSPPNVNRQILWEVDEQRQKIINQTGFSNSFFPFH